MESMMMVGFGQMSRVAGIVALAMVACCGTGLAQETGADSPFARMQAKLKAGDRVTVSLEDGSTVKGRFLDAGAGALSISTPAGDRRLLPSAVTQVQRHRRGVLLGAIIGGGIGLACGAAVGSLFANEGHDRDGPLFGLTALGLGAGIAIDAFANIPRTVYERKPTRVTFTIEAGPRRTAAGVVVLF
jgi:hypothetical protein